MANYTITGDSFTHSHKYLYEFGNPETHRQRQVTVGLTATPTLVATVNGRSVVRAGTPYPADDATAEGIIMWDVDVTDGDRQIAMFYQGSINLPRLIEYYGQTPTAACLQELHENRGFYFFPEDQYKALVP